jgi:hypothetical protein
VVNALLETVSLEAQYVVVYDRSPERLHQFYAGHPEATVAETPRPRLLEPLKSCL